MPCKSFVSDNHHYSDVQLLNAKARWINGVHEILESPGKEITSSLKNGFSFLFLFYDLGLSFRSLVVLAKTTESFFIDVSGIFGRENLDKFERT